MTKLFIATAGILFILAAFMDAVIQPRRRKAPKRASHRFPSHRLLNPNLSTTRG